MLLDGIKDEVYIMFLLNYSQILIFFLKKEKKRNPLELWAT
jgi:hypothetical protein